MAFSLVSCRRSSSPLNAAKVDRGGSVSIAISEPRNLLPQQTLDIPGIQVDSALFTPLVEYDARTMAPRNAMAASITSSDQRVWTIRIKDGWTFHNGEPVTAQSFVDAWNFGARAESVTSSYFSSIDGADEVSEAKNNPVPLKGLRVVDPSTFQVTLSEPFSQFPVTLGFNAFAPLPRAAFQDPAAFREAPVGNGPYRIDGPWEHDRAIRVRRFEGYAGERPGLEQIEFRIYSDQATAYRDVQGGTLDVSPVPANLAHEARTSLGDRLLTTTGSEFVYLGMPLYDARFARPEVRRAFSLALDRDAIINTVRNGVGRPASAVVPPIVPGARENVCQYCRLDPDRARQLLQQGGGFSGDLVLWMGKEGRNESTVEAISNQLRQTLGIGNVQIRSELNAEYFQLMDDHKMTGPFLTDWIMDYPSAQNYLEPMFGETGAKTWGYQNPMVTDLIKRGNAARSLDEAITSYQRAEDMIVEDLPVIPLWFSQGMYVYSNRVVSLVVDARSLVREVQLRN